MFAIGGKGHDGVKLMNKCSIFIEIRDAMMMLS